MNRILLVIFMGVALLYGESSNRDIKLSKRGEKIVKALCDKERLPQPTRAIPQLITAIKESKACPPLPKSKLEAIAYYLRDGALKVSKEYIVVPDDAKCVVCGMFVYKYPKWASSITHSGRVYYFDGVKDMMKYYIFDGDFVYNRDKITQIVVSDYYTIEAIDAREAFYVVGSTIFGPMGHELIAFRSLKSAKVFSKEHNGKAILKFEDIDDSVVMGLDGVEQ